MWKFHWHWTDEAGDEQTTSQTAVPIGEPVPTPPDVATGTLTAVTLEPEEEPPVDPATVLGPAATHDFGADRQGEAWSPRANTEGVVPPADVAEPPAVAPA